jgi:hypothetical protein
MTEFRSLIAEKPVTESSPSGARKLFHKSGVDEWTGFVTLIAVI